MEAARNAIPFLKSKTDKYDVLYVNTPWSKLDTVKISKFPAKDLTKENAAIFLWVDTYKAREVMTIIDAWGFKFHSVYQIADVAQYAWMKKTPSKKKEGGMENIENDGDIMEGSNETKEDTKKAKKPKTPVVRKFKMPTVSPPSWWSIEPETTLGTRSTTEQLWLATRGDASDIFTGDSTPSQVVNLPELGKKSKPKKKNVFSTEWDTERPATFLDSVVEKLSPGKNVLDVFSASVRDNMDSWGPGVPGGFVNALSSNEGIVGDINTTMRAMKKTQLQTLTSKLAKYDTATTDEKKTLVETISGAWTPISTTLEGKSYGIPYVLKDDNTDTPMDWVVFLVQALASKNVAEFDSLRGRKKKRKSTASSSDRPRHGIACASNITPELADFFGMDHSEKIARTVAVSRLNEYIVKNGLQNPERKIEIMLDEPLRRLLNPSDDFGIVTYFNLCKLVGKHFPKKTDAEKKADAESRARKRKEEKENKSKISEDVNVNEDGDVKEVKVQVKIDMGENESESVPENQGPAKKVKVTKSS